MADFIDPDPLRLALKARTREATQRAIDALDPLDPGSWQARSDLITTGASEWAPWFQALKEAGRGRPVKLAGGPSPEGSNQLRGTQGLEFGHGARAMEISAPEHRRSSGIADNPAWWVGETDPATVSIPQLEQRMKAMPASLYGLYAAGLRRKAKA